MRFTRVSVLSVSVSVCFCFGPPPATPPPLAAPSSDCCCCVLRAGVLLASDAAASSSSRHFGNKGRSRICPVPFRAMSLCCTTVPVCLLRMPYLGMRTIHTWVQAGVVALALSCLSVRWAPAARYLVPVPRPSYLCSRTWHNRGATVLERRPCPPCESFSSTFLQSVGHSPRQPWKAIDRGREGSQRSASASGTATRS